MTSDQFAKLIKGKQGYQIIFKLMLFAYLMKQISKHKLGSKHSTEFLNTCHHYLKSIQNQPSLFQTFIIQYFRTNQLPITEKLFFSQLLFPFFLPQRFVQELMKQLNTYWHGDQFLEPTSSKGFSEQNQLIYAFLIPVDERQKIITTFSKYLGSFGHYFSTQSFYHQFNVFPKPFCSFNGTFLALFFSTVFSLDDNKLHLNVLTNYSSIAFTGLKTPYGQLDLSIQKDSVSKIHTVEIKHEFHTPPSAIILTCPPKFNMFAFNDSNQQHPINDGQVSVL